MKGELVEVLYVVKRGNVASLVSGNNCHTRGCRDEYAFCNLIMSKKYKTLRLFHRIRITIQDLAAILRVILIIPAV